MARVIYQGIYGRAFCHDDLEEGVTTALEALRAQHPTLVHLAYEGPWWIGEAVAELEVDEMYLIHRLSDLAAVAPAAEQVARVEAFLATLPAAIATHEDLADCDVWLVRRTS